LPAAYVTAVSSAGFAMQDISLLPFSGVWVDPGTGAPGVKRGNQVAVTGVYLDPFGQAQVQASTVTIVDAGTSLPFSAIVAVPADIKTGGPKADAYQSMLVVLASPTVTNDKPDGTSQFFEFVVDNGCRVDDFLYPKYGTSGSAYPPAGYTNNSTFSALYGVLGFSFSDSKLWPRDAADIVP